MDERERRAAAEMAETARLRAEAEEDRSAAELAKREVERNRIDSLNRIEKECETQKNRLIEAARTEVDGLKTAWVEEFGRQKEEISRTLAKECAEIASDGAKRIVAEIAGTGSIHINFDQIIESLRSALRTQPLTDPVTVISAEPLSEILRHELTILFHESGCDEIQFENDPELIFGISVTGGGFSFHRNARNHTGEFRSRLLAVAEKGVAP